jgi:hypothetical protein
MRPKAQELIESKLPMEQVPSRQACFGLQVRGCTKDHIFNTTHVNVLSQHRHDGLLKLYTRHVGPAAIQVVGRSEYQYLRMPIGLEDFQCWATRQTPMLRIIKGTLDHDRVIGDHHMLCTPKQGLGQRTLEVGNNATASV